MKKLANDYDNDKNPSKNPSLESNLYLGLHPFHWRTLSCCCCLISIGNDISIKFIDIVCEYIEYIGDKEAHTRGACFVMDSKIIGLVAQPVIFISVFPGRSSIV